MARSKQKKKQAESSEDGSDVEYEVRAVVSHKFKAGQMHYLASWVGYGVEDNTWQPDDTMESARACVAKYWKDHPNHPDCPDEFRKASTPSKKRANNDSVDKDAPHSDSNAKKQRKSTVAVESTSTKKPDSRPASPIKASSNKGKAAQNHNKPESSNRRTHTNESKSLASKYADKASWDDLCKVETVQDFGNEDGEKYRVCIKWNEKPEETCWLVQSEARRRCPQRILDVFDDSLKFKE